MRKYAELCPPDARPDLFFALPELHYPPRLNAVEAVFDGAAASGWGDRAAFFHDGAAITFAAVETEVRRTAGALRRLGVRPGDRVLLRMADAPALVYTLLAVQAIGAVAVPTYVQLRADDLVYRVEDASATCLVADAALVDEVAPVAAKCAGLAHVVVAPEDPTGRFASLAALLPGEAPPADYHDSGAEDLCLLLYSSGSTGDPKGTAHCHRDMLAIADTYWRHSVAPAADDVIAGPPSIAFALGFGMFVYFPLRLGHAAVLDPDKSPEAALRTIARHRVTIFAGVVSYYGALARLIEATGADISSLRRAMTGGEPLPEEAERQWLQTTGLPLEQFIGTTEMLHCFVTSTRPDGPPRAATLGRPVPGYQVAVLDSETFRPVASGAQGLLAVRGPTGTVYWNKPDQQAATVIGGWNVFQDVVTMDADGHLHYVARHDDMIVSAGYNISPVQVETVLMRHPAVGECACVPAADPTGRRGAIVKAFVVPAPDAAAGETLAAGLQEWFKANGPPYMYPRAIEFLDALPKTVNGKILRSALRARSSP